MYFIKCHSVKVTFSVYKVVPSLFLSTGISAEGEKEGWL